MNLIEGRVVDGRVPAVPRSTSAPAARAARRRRPTPQPGDTVWVALRPEKIAHRARAPDAHAARTASPGTSRDIGYLGDVSIYKVRLDNGFVMKAAVAN